MKQVICTIVLLCTLTLLPDATACLTIPAPARIVTSLYGWRCHPTFNNCRLHRGIDLRASLGTRLVAAQNGVVQVSSSASGGNEIRILADDGTVTRYLHLTRPIVDPGTSVLAGQPVAVSGNTGHASNAPHLHFEVHKKKGRSMASVNPEPLLCEGMSRKPGIDMENGVPIKRCRPGSGHCNNSPRPGRAPTAPSPRTPSPPPVKTPSAEAPSQPPPSPSPTVERFDDISTAEILATEVIKRFANPDWYKEQAERTIVPLLIEYLQMKALEWYIDFHKQQARERIEALLATRLAYLNRQEMEERLHRQREVAAKASAGIDNF